MTMDNESKVDFQRVDTKVKKLVADDVLYSLFDHRDGRYLKNFKMEAQNIGI